MPDVYEFFAGGGMVRAGLGSGWTCRFANDRDAKKALAYQANWGTSGELKVCDVADVRTSDLPGRADLVWASFPCQDLSLAGAGAGLGGERSGAFHPFFDVVRALVTEGRAPGLIALENVVGTLTSHAGADFAAICETFAEAGYRCGALVIDAALFVPQSRPRLFMIGVHGDVAIDPALLASAPRAPFHTPAVQRALDGVDTPTRERMVWWRLPEPPRRNIAFADLIEEEPDSVSWRSDAETAAILRMMSLRNQAKVAAVQASGRRTVGGVYRRTRQDAEGRKAQRAEVRFDDVAGCLRTPAGGSSRQLIMVVEGERIRTRLISAREAARLMGLPDGYRLPPRYNDAYHLLGDGVVAPVVRHLAGHLFEPLLGLSGRTQAAA